jgi:hypothetical protein
MMLIRALIYLLLFLISPSLIATETVDPPEHEPRKWTNTTGKSITASIQSATDADVTLLVKGKSNPNILKLEDLSQGDQDYVKNWLVLKGKYEEYRKELAFSIQGVKITPGKLQEFEMIIDVERWGKNPSYIKPTYKLGLIVPPDFDPINKRYTLINIAANTSLKEPLKQLPTFSRLALEGDCIVFSVDDNAFVNYLPMICIYDILEEKWGLKSKKLPVAYYGYSGGAKRATYNLGHGVLFNLNVIGAYLGGCNEDRTKDIISNFKLNDLGKSIYRKVPVWLSSGTADKVATPDQVEKVAKSLEKHGVENVKINTHPSGHALFQDDLIPALKWMKELHELREEK